MLCIALGILFIFFCHNRMNRTCRIVNMKYYGNAYAYGNKGEHAVFPVVLFVFAQIEFLQF